MKSLFSITYLHAPMPNDGHAGYRSLISINNETSLTFCNQSNQPWYLVYMVIKWISQNGWPIKLLKELNIYQPCITS